MAGGDSNSTESLLNSPWTKLLGSATVVAAIIYVSGAAVMALRIWNSGLSWQPVVGQLPHDTLLSVGFAQVLAPAVLGSIIAGWVVTRKPGRWLYDEVSKRINHGAAEGDPPTRRGIRAWTTRAAFWLLASAVVTAILLIPTLAIWRVTSGRVDPGARRPIDELVALAAVAILVAIQPFFLYRQWRWAGSGVMRVATATGLLLIPAVVAAPRLRAVLSFRPWCSAATLSPSWADRRASVRSVAISSAPAATGRMWLSGPSSTVRQAAPTSSQFH